ncbi:uncharacterized protein LOC119745181 [Patiria miniata]|uniref:DDE-1 domain-containing protein n=1 Tax=Patiria miniata TaxID=46514 RepID=A0A914BPB6_PATMI|nr:uncharacterized protein LOC119745181 [Patiria miniata]
MSRRSILEAYFGKLLEVLEKYNLRDCPAQIYNVDETGITRDRYHKPPKSLGPSQGAFNAVSCGRGPIHTIIACGNAMGNRLTPYIIFKGARVRQEWTEGTLSGTGYNATKTGWSNSATFLQWFKGHFLPQVGSVRPLLLLYDGHSTHISVQIIEEARLEGVHLFVIPPHTSHILQPLDVGCFAPFKATYNRAVHNWLHKYKNTGRILVEEDIASLACKAYMMGISSDSLVSSFRCTGICPFNPDVVLSKLPEQPERGSSSIDGLFAPIEKFPSTPEVFARRPKAIRSARMLTEEDEYLKVKSKQGGRKSKEPTPQAADLALAADLLAPAADHLAPAADHLAASYDESPPMSPMPPPLSPLITPSMPIPTIASSATEAPKSPPLRATCTVSLLQSQEPSTSRCCRKASSPDPSSDDVSDEDDNCVVCNRRWPKNVKKTGGPKIILWARCDKCYSWVHLKYCCNRVTEPTIEEEFLCPICSVGTRKREL